MIAMSDSAAARVPLRFQIGARTIAAVPRRLIRRGLTLDEALAGLAPPLPPPGDADGYLVTSLAEAAMPATLHAGYPTLIRQRYPRHWIDLAIGHDAWRAGLSANARSSLTRKTRKLEQAGRVEIRLYRRPEELVVFHRLARPVAALTYQERLLGAALPATPAFLAAMRRAAAADAARGWLLLVDERPVAYLYGAAEGGALRYDHVGHDPAWNALSPGTVLHARAMADLFAEARFARFDFTEGDGQHKRQFASHAVACVDLLMLRPTIVNRATLGLLSGWDVGMAAAKRATRTPALKRIADRVRRA